MKITAKELLDSLYPPIGVDINMCRCGDLQCHTIEICSKCGGKFNILPRSITLRDVIKAKATWQYLGSLKLSTQWFYEINKRNLKADSFKEFWEEVNK